MTFYDVLNNWMGWILFTVVVITSLVVGSISKLFSQGPTC